MTCEHQYVSTSKSQAVTGFGIFGVIVFIVGLFTLIGSLLLGAIVCVAGVLIGMVGRRKEAIVCAKCGEPSPHQP